MPKSDPYLYTEGEYLKPADAWVKLTLTKPCPTGGLVLPLGVACASGPTKTATLLSWSAVLSAVAKAVQESPAIRADLRRILGIPIRPTWTLSTRRRFRIRTCWASGTRGSRAPTSNPQT